MSNLSSVPLAVAMIAAFVLIAGGIKLALVRDTRFRGALMIVAALVLIGNVLIWTI
ncbi:MAG: hypothetical protein ACJ8EY_06360 [Sphingomicrobium sp.]